MSDEKKPVTLSVLVKVAGLVGVLLSGATAAFGTVSDSDVHRLNQTVVNNFNDPAPGDLFEVVGDKTDRICRFSNAETGTQDFEPRYQRYYNALGSNLPVPELIDRVFGGTSGAMQIAVEWQVATSGLKSGFLGKIEGDCERKAQRVHDRADQGSVVCVVDSVMKRPGTEQIIGVRFKPYAMTPAGATVYPLCPLRLPSDVFWNIRRTFISVSPMEKPEDA